MTAENEVRITLTDVFNRQDSNYKETTQILGEIKTSIAVLAESVKPQQGINSELFKRVLALEKKVWALSGLSSLLAVITSKLLGV